MGVMDPDLKDVFRAAIKAKLIRGPQMLMMVMHTRSNRGRTPTELKDITGLSAPSIGMSMAAMAEKGLMERHDRFRDRRSGAYYLTPEGETVAANLWKALLKLADARPKLYRERLPDPDPIGD